MNNVYENNMKFVPFLKFINKYKIIIIITVISILLFVAYFVISNQIKKQNNEKASVIFNDWKNEISKENLDQDALTTIIGNLLENYEATGYTQLALLDHANYLAKSNNFEESLKSFNKVIELTNGFNGNKIYNKMARISAARILIDLERYDESLQKIEIYSSTNTNAYIHELIGDILLKQQKNDLAIEQYNLASEKYADETSRSIISMKIASVGY